MTDHHHHTHGHEDPHPDNVHYLPHSHQIHHHHGHDGSTLYHTHDLDEPADEQKDGTGDTHEHLYWNDDDIYPGDGWPHHFCPALHGDTP